MESTSRLPVPSVLLASFLSTEIRTDTHVWTHSRPGSVHSTSVSEVVGVVVSLSFLPRDVGASTTRRRLGVQEVRVPVTKDGRRSAVRTMWKAVYSCVTSHKEAESCVRSFSLLVPSGSRGSWLPSSCGGSGCLREPVAVTSVRILRDSLTT